MPSCLGLSNSNMTLVYTGFMQLVSVPMKYVEQGLAVRFEASTETATVRQEEG